MNTLSLLHGAAGTLVLCGALAAKLHATRQLDRAGRTLNSAGARGIVSPQDGLVAC